MKCKYYNVCPSCSGWCNNCEPNGDCIEFILSAYETKSKIIDDIIEASYNGEYDEDDFIMKVLDLVGIERE